MIPDIELLPYTIHQQRCPIQPTGPLSSSTQYFASHLRGHVKAWKRRRTSGFRQLSDANFQEVRENCGKYRKMWRQITQSVHSSSLPFQTTSSSSSSSSKLGKTALLSATSKQKKIYDCQQPRNSKSFRER